MKKKFLAINKNDIRKFEKKRRLVLQHNYFLNNEEINFDEVHDIFLKKKELKIYYREIKKNYFKYLNFLHKRLNDLNDTNKSKRYWNILIGPWLLEYLQSMTRKWIEIKKISKKNEINYNYYFTKKPYIPEDHLDYNELIKNEQIFSLIYSDILKNYLYEKKKVYKSFCINNYSHKFLKIENISSIRKILFKFFNFFRNKKKSNIVILNTYMGHLREISLYIKTKTLPLFFTNLNEVRNLFYRNSIPNNFIKRKNLLKNYKTKNKFELFLKKNFENFFPKSYLENFNRFDELSTDLFPQKTNFIISAVDHFAYDNLKYWIGNQTMRGSKLLTIQHGANPGYSLFTQNEFNDKNISNTNFTWGWKDKFKSTKKGFFSFKEIKNIKYKRKYLLIVIPGNIALQKNIKSNLYFYDNLSFYNIFIPLIKKIYKIYPEELMVRLPKISQKEVNKYYRNQIKKISPNIKIDRNEKFTKSLEISKAIITSWDQTIFLQSLNADIPTFAYWNKKTSIVDDKSVRFFLDLKKKSILFDDTNKFIDTFQNSYSNIDNWWTERNRNKIIQSFVKQYCRKGNLVKYLADFCNKQRI